MRALYSTALLILVLVSAAAAAEPRIIRGHVVDADGKPVGGAALDFFWGGNGPIVDADGKPLKLDTEEQVKAYWQRFGQMEPFLKSVSKLDGSFAVPARGDLYTLMAMDAERVRGGLVAIPKIDDGAEIEIRLQPLIRVEGSIKGCEPGKQPDHLIVVVEVEEDPTRPLDMTRLVLAEPRDARFKLLLPPGKYLLDMYDSEFKGRLYKEINLSGDEPQVDLGTFTLAPATPNINDRIKLSQESGAMRDYTKHYGEKLPDWHITDARGVSKDVKLADFKGKWVLVDFWALNCGVCLKRTLPNLTKFYEEHAAQRDQFEILAICVDCNGELKSVAEVDRKLEPIVKHVWNGKPLPFPILLDPSMTTLERFGVPGYETILIDPEGRLVEGDETVLAEKLKK
jgi:thiol-disulfide isomerase/thioredoxin